MNGWSEWRRHMKRASSWEEREPGDPEIESLRKIFRSAGVHHPGQGHHPGHEKSDHEIGERVWKSLRPRLHALGETPFAPASIWPALAAAGPRFALGAACALIIMAGVFFSQVRNAPSPPSLVAARPGPAIILADIRMVETPQPTLEEYPAQALQTSDGDELLRFIAYSSPSR